MASPGQGWKDGFFVGWMCIALSGLMFMPVEAQMDADMYTIEYLTEMGISLEPGSGRPFVYSGRGSSFFYGSTRTLAEEGWMGFHWDRRKLWDDWLVAVDGVPLDRNEATVTVYPHQVVFSWPQGYEVSIRLLGVRRDDLQFVLRGVGSGQEANLFLVFPTDSEIPPSKLEKPLRFLPVMVPLGADTVGVAFGSSQKFAVRRVQPANLDAASGSAGKLFGKAIWGVGFEDGDFECSVVYGDNPMVLDRRLNEIYETPGLAWQQRKQWLLQEINRAYFWCDDARFTKAVNWAKVSLAGLFFEDEEGVLLWAGLPWFNNSWGRDTFISLPGACLVLGKYDDARAILQRYARWQMRDPDSPDWGKIPNLVSGGDIVYNTADGTPWFVREVYEYGLYSGDTELWREYLQPETGAMWLANQGALEKRVDQYHLLTHGEADTWMDAKGIDGAWSPRGDRAVEIQALWITQLDVSVKMAEALGEANPVPEETLQRWREVRKAAKKSFLEQYVRENAPGLVDHLNPDGSKDDKIRPNQLWAITAVSDSLLNEETARSVVEQVREHCVYEWGGASLAQDDPDFHPYHQTHHYPKDEAYHMGIVWTWLAGPFISAAGGAWPLTENMATQILDWGAPGTLSENLDAIPRDGNDRPYCSGTVTQTWSLAEFLRNLYQDYLGVKPCYGEYELYRQKQTPRWALQPHIPQTWDSVNVLVPVGDFFLGVDLHENRREPAGMIRYQYLSANGKAVERDYLPIKAIPVSPGKAGVFSLSFCWYYLYMDGAWSNGDLLGFETIPGEAAFPPSSANEDMAFLQPHVAEDLKALAPPPWYLMSQAEVTTRPHASLPVVSVSEPESPERSKASYTYPKAPVFQEGMFDLERFMVREDGLRIYFELNFKRLVDPGWHPEYGYQLTFAALCIRTGTEGEATRAEVGRNAHWTLDEGWEADRFLYVGGPIDLEDAAGEMLAQYIPRDEQGRIGNVETGKVTFGIPRRFLPGDPSQWKITVLIGGQDDHGGAGVGEFRSVEAEATEWTGGGGGPDKHNVYDWMRATSP